MNFSQQVSEKSGAIFNKYNLHVIEERNNFLKLECPNLTMVISHNWRGKENAIWLGNVDIDDEALKLFFHSDLKLSRLPVELFIDNLISFFDNEAQSLLLGDKRKLSELEAFDLDRSKKFTQDLLRRQILTEADKAWDNGDFNKFSQLIDEINIDEVQPSYQLKYRIAKKKL